MAARTDDTGHARFLDLPHGEANVTVIWRNRNDHMETKSVLLAGASAKLGFTYVPPEGQ